MNRVSESRRNDETASRRTGEPANGGTGEAPPPAADSPARPLSGSIPLRALVVENDLASRELLARVLRLKGLRADTVIGAAQAAAILLDQPAAFDLLVVDLNLEPVDGVELLRHVAQLAPDRRPWKIVAIGDSLAAFYPRLSELRIPIETFQKPVHLPSLMKVVEDARPANFQE
jgi:CheY-like chemotaxis protein